MPGIDVTAAGDVTNDARARSNVLRLAAAQALTGANSAVIFATGSIVGASLAPDVSFATVPISMYVVGLAAGTLGAWGALTLTLAMFSGGKPYVVMPIVFGGAVTVSALVSVWKEPEHTTVNPLLWVGVVGIVVCAAMVAYFTPPAAPPANASAAVSTTAPPSS